MLELGENHLTEIFWAQVSLEPIRHFIDELLPILYLSLSEDGVYEFLLHLHMYEVSYRIDVSFLIESISVYPHPVLSFKLRILLLIHIIICIKLLDALVEVLDCKVVWDLSN